MGRLGPGQRLFSAQLPSVGAAAAEIQRSRLALGPSTLQARPQRYSSVNAEAPRDVRSRRRPPLARLRLHIRRPGRPFTCGLQRVQSGADRRRKSYTLGRQLLPRLNRAARCRASWQRALGFEVPRVTGAYDWTGNVYTFCFGQSAAGDNKLVVEAALSSRCSHLDEQRPCWQVQDCKQSETNIPATPRAPFVRASPSVSRKLSAADLLINWW